MRNTASFLLLLLLFMTVVKAQEDGAIPKGVVTIKENPKIDLILKLKIEFDRTQYNSEYHTIQLFYGTDVEARKTLSDFEEKYPEMRANLSFETPNYKVQTGYFKSRIKAIKQLELIKKDFPEAFLITRK